VEINRFFYIYDRAKRQEIYLTDKFALIYRKSYNSLIKETNPNAIQDMLNRYIFWLRISIDEDSKIINKDKKTILKIKDKISRFQTTIKRYVFSNDINIVPIKVSETVSTTTGGNYRSQAMNTYYFEDINRRQQFEMHPEIKKALSSLN